jgi:hypothetical protein
MEASVALFFHVSSRRFRLAGAPARARARGAHPPEEERSRQLSRSDALRTGEASGEALGQGSSSCSEFRRSAV